MNYYYFLFVIIYYQFIHHYNYINGIQRNFYIEPWFTPNHGYLQIYKQNHQNSDCDKKLQVKILLRSPKSYYGNLMFQIQARSEMILSGHYDQSTKNTILTNVQNQKTEDFVNIHLVYFLRLTNCLSYVFWEWQAAHRAW